MNKLYHKDIYIPPNLLPNIYGTYYLSFSKHAKDSCITDRYGYIFPPTSVEVDIDNLLEVETAPNTQIINKIVIRQPYKETLDLSLVFIPEGKLGFVKTLWLNEKSDSHFTLDPAPYSLI